MATLTGGEAIELIAFITWLHNPNLRIPIGEYGYETWDFAVVSHRSIWTRSSERQRKDERWKDYSGSLEAWKKTLQQRRLSNQQQQRTLAEVRDFFANPNMVTVSNYTLVHAAVIYLRLDILTILHKIGARFDDEPQCDHLLKVLLNVLSKQTWGESPEFRLCGRGQDDAGEAMRRAHERALEIWEFLLVVARVDPGPRVSIFSRPPKQPNNGERLLSIYGGDYNVDIPKNIFTEFFHPDLIWRLLRIMFKHGLIPTHSLADIFQKRGTSERLQLLKIAAECKFDFNQRCPIDGTIATHTVLTWVIANAHTDNTCSLEELKLMLDTVIVTGHADPNAEIQYRIHSEEDWTSTKNDDRGASKKDLDTWRRSDLEIVWCWVDSNKNRHPVTDKDRGSFTPLHYLVAIVAFQQIGKSSAEDIGQIAKHLILRGADVTRKCIVPNIKDGRYTRGDVSERAVTPLEYLEQVKAASNNPDIQQHLEALQQTLSASQQSYTAAPVCMSARGHTGLEEPAGAAAAPPPPKRPRRN